MRIYNKVGKLAKAVFPLFLFALLPFVTSCTGDNEEARTPQAVFSVAKTDLNVNESMELTFTGIADQVVVFTGDDMHEYVKRTESNTGFVIYKGVFTYAYSTPGTYTVTVIASTYDTYLGSNQQIDIKEFQVTVSDNATKIESIYANITPNVYIAEAINDHDWVLALPTKQMNNNKEIALKPTNQRLAFTLESDNIVLYIDDAEYNYNKSKFDLSKKHEIRAVAPSGAEREYTLYGIIYPELSDVKAGDQALTLQRNSYYQDMLTFVYPAGTDVSNVALTFTTDADAKFYANGTEVTSGTTLDLTDQTVNYTLVRTLVENSAVQATTRIYFAAAE